MLGIYRIFFVGIILTGIFMANSLFLKQVDAEDGAINQGPMVVVLERHYLDGDKSEEIIIENLSASEIQEKYADWVLVHVNGNRIVFKKYVDDISPLLKSNGFFGVTDDGTLSIFNGKPDVTNVIHSFFQIDMGKLETKTQKELVKGIPVRTKEDFLHVLEAFKPYSVTVEE